MIQMGGSHLNRMQHTLEQASPHTLHRKDAKDENSNPAVEGQE